MKHFLFITIITAFAACAPEPVKMAYNTGSVSVVYQNGFEYELNHNNGTITVNTITEPGEMPDPVFIETGSITPTAPGVYVFEGKTHTFKIDVPNESVTTDWMKR